MHMPDTRNRDARAHVSDLVERSLQPCMPCKRYMANRQEVPAFFIPRKFQQERNDACRANQRKALSGIGLADFLFASLPVCLNALRLAVTTKREGSQDVRAWVTGFAGTRSIQKKVTPMENQFNQTTGRYSAAAHQTVDRLAENAHPAVDRLAKGAHEAVDRLAGVATSAAERIGKQADQLNASRQRLGDSCSTYVHDNPLTSIGLAVAAGYLLSRLLGSR